MGALSGAAQAVIESGGDDIARYLSVCPRTVVKAGMVTGVITDLDSGLAFGVTFALLAGPGSLHEGQTVDFGSAAGLADVGKVRLRGWLGDPTGYLWFAATSPAALDIAYGDRLTVRDEYRPWQVLSRVVEGSSPGPGLISITEYKDFDIPYAGSDHRDPKANITAGLDASSDWIAVTPAGWEDNPGDGYRTISLTSDASVAWNGKTIASVLWSIADCTLLFGALSSNVILLRVPVGFRHIFLTVTDSAGRTGWMALPLWTHSAAFPPIKQFYVSMDETYEGRDMTFELFGDSVTAPAEQIGAGATCCYWEVATFNGGQAPMQYRDAFLGWASEDAVLLKLEDVRYSVKVGGMQWWLDHLDGTSTTLTDTGTTATRFSEMEHIRMVEAMDYALRMYSNARNLVNVYYPVPSGYDAQVVDFNQSSLWKQLGDLGRRDGYRVPLCDSLGHIWLRKHTSYLQVADRSAVPVIISLVKKHWGWQRGLTLPELKQPSYGTVVGGGSFFYDRSIDSALYLTQAPGKTRGYGMGRDEMAAQFLGGDAPASTLNKLSGQRLAHLNNARPNVQIELVHNLDVFEPAWGEIVHLTWLDSTPWGTVLNAEPFRVTRVSVRHGRKADDPPKRITLSLEQLTQGGAGQTREARQRVDVFPPEEPLPPRYPEPDDTPTGVPIKLVAADLGSGKFARALSWNPITGVVTWEEISNGLPSGVHGCHFSADPFDYRVYYYYVGGDATHVGGLYRCGNVWAATPLWELVKSAFDIFGNTNAWIRVLRMSINRRGFIAMTSGGSTIAVSYDGGVSWLLRNFHGGAPAPSLDGSPISAADLQMSPYNGGSEGWGYMTGDHFGVHYIYKTTDWCNTFAASGASGDLANGGSLNVPYIRADGTTPNENNSGQELLAIGGVGHGANVGRMFRSQNAGVSMTQIYAESASGITVPTATPIGSSLNTWTWDGSEIIAASLRTGAGGNQSGFMRFKNGTKLVGVHLAGPNQTGHVNGFPTSKLYALQWTHSSPHIYFTLDGGTFVEMTFPPFFDTGGSYGACEVQWDLSDFVEPVP